MSMGGMSMGNMPMGDGVPSLFTIQQMYWAVVGTAIAVATLANILNKIVAAQRFSDTTATPSRPKSIWFRSYATITAVTRELAHASIGPIAIGKLKLYPPRLGPLVIVLANVVVLMVLCFYKLDTNDQWDWEDLGYRTGFVSIGQLPLIVLLAGKNNIIGLLTGSSYERLNRFHRWVSRTLWLTATIHMSFWFRSWGRFHYIAVKVKTDPITQKGLAAWSILTFIVLTTFSPVRRLSHEIFIVSHLLTMAGFLAAIWFHAQDEVKVWVWIAIGIVIFDRIGRHLFMVYNNFSVFHRRQDSSSKKGLFTNVATFTPLPGNVTKVSVSDPTFSWKPGQHVFLSCHSILPFQSHPFTISSIPCDRKLEFLVRAETGGTRKFFAYARKCATTLAPSPTTTSRIVTIDGPYGRIRNLKQFNSIIFIAGGMGATFTMPLMRDIVQGWVNECRSVSQSKSRLFRTRTLVKRIHFVWVLKEQSYMRWFEGQFRQLMHDFEMCRQADPAFNKQLEVSIYVTCDTELSSNSVTLRCNRRQSDPETSRPSSAQEVVETKAEKTIVNKREPPDEAEATPHGKSSTSCLADGEPGCCCTVKVTDINKTSTPCTCSVTTSIPVPVASPNDIPVSQSDEISSERPADPPSPSPPVYTPFFPSTTAKDADVGNTGATTRVLPGRPDVRETIRSLLEKAGGESAVVACGPPGLNADACQSVVSLSDERAVHKGTGAQGIYLHVEQFGY